MLRRESYLLVSFALALTGCNLLDKPDAHYDDARNPNYKEAQQALDNNDPSAAAKDYQKALAADSKLAGAHYQLGLLYSDKLADPVSAIYHFKRYLELAPTSDKADQVKGLIDKEGQAFAASLPNAATQGSDDVARLQAENAALKKQVEDATHTIGKLQGQLAQSGRHHTSMASAPAVVASVPAPGTEAAPADVTAPATPPTPAATPTAASAEPAAATAGVPPKALPLDSITSADTNAPAPAINLANSRSYKVVAGDSFWKIAKKMYHDDTKNGVEKIKEANKETAPEGKPLKIGQVLIIPE